MWLSIDWDFFQEELVAWDWGHRESPFFMEAIWAARAITPKVIETTDPEANHPKASEFWKLLRTSVTFTDDCKLVIADSHAFAGPYFCNQDRVIDAPADLIVNIDAHHDLGYTSASKLDKMWRENKCEAGSWLYMVLKRHRRLKALQLYPEWKTHDLESEAEAEGCPWKKSPIAKRVTLGTFNIGWFEKSTPVSRIFIARSGAWSPPWNDGAFWRFVADSGFESSMLEAMQLVRPFKSLK